MSDEFAQILNSFCRRLSRMQPVATCAFDSSLMGPSKGIQAAGDTEGALVQLVRLDNRCVDVSVAEWSLNGAQVVAGLQEVCGEGVPQNVGSEMDRQRGFPSGPTLPGASARITTSLRGRSIGH